MSCGSFLTLLPETDYVNKKVVFYFYCQPPPGCPIPVSRVGASSVKKLLDCFPVLFLSEKFKNDILIFIIDSAAIELEDDGAPGLTGARRR